MATGSSPKLSPVLPHAPARTPAYTLGVQPTPSEPRAPVFSLPFASVYRTLRMAAHALRRNVLRSALTTLGIIIGVGAVIAMMEIGQGSSHAVQRTIASMGANILLVQPGTAASGGVSFGSGSVITLTPQDGEAILRDCPAVNSQAPIVRARCQVVYGNRNWVPLFIYGTTPAFLEVREWPLEEGEEFTDRDVRNGNKVCVLGTTLVKELFQGESPLGKEVRVQNVSFRVIGVLARKGANMMGLDQDDILLAPWTTIKYRVSGSSLASVNQSTPGAVETGVNHPGQYPGAQAGLYPAQSATQLADTPQPVRFTNVDQILVRAESTAEIPTAIRQINELLHERHHIKEAQPEDFNLRDMTEMTKALASTSSLMTGFLV